jgi:ABC-type antimicrobial peptide transport system permease subunit
MNTSTTANIEWEGMQASLQAQGQWVEIMNVSEEYLRFYRFQLTEGEWLKNHDENDCVLINESAAKLFGWNSATGKTLTHKEKGDKTYRVKGVVKDIYYEPVTKARAIVFFINMNFHGATTLFKYREGQWLTVKEKIEQLVKTEYPTQSLYMYNAEQRYAEYLKSENALLQLLSFASLVCIIVSVFGFFSLVSLRCEERRKEIAVRKVNGATVNNILNIFLKEYFLLLAAGAVIAFPVSHYIMRTWLEQYVKQTTVGVWVYLSILLLLTLAILLCVGRKVYKTGRENPAEVLKSE